ncbi:MAG: hypothetical protein AB1758_19210 [Candidatus Eremiobacterota bacterium]
MFNFGVNQFSGFPNPMGTQASFALGFMFGMQAGQSMVLGNPSFGGPPMFGMQPQMMNPGAQAFMMAQLLQAWMQSGQGQGIMPGGCYGPYQPPQHQYCPHCGLPRTYYDLPMPFPGGGGMPFPMPGGGQPYPFPQPQPFPYPQPQPGPFPQPWYGPRPQPQPQPQPLPKPVVNPNQGPPPRPAALSQNAWMQGLKQNPKAYQAYQNLTPEQRKQVDTLGTQYGTRDGKVDPNFVKLLNTGRLTAKDKEGHTTLDHLNTVHTQKLAPGLDRYESFTDLTRTLADPGTTRQNNRGTCSPTTIEFLHARQQPADFARVSAGLLSEKGQVKLQNGDTITRNQSGLARDDSGRSSVDRIYQSSMMEYGNGNETYDNVKDTNITPSGREIGSGLARGKSQEVMNAVLGEEYRVNDWNGSRFDDGRGKWRFEQDLKADLDSGKRPWVSMNWDPNPNARDANHALSIEKIDGEYVYLRNPWGADEKGGNNGPTREVMDKNGLVRMKKDDFYEHLNGTIEYQGNDGFFTRNWNRLRYAFSSEAEAR